MNTSKMQAQPLPQASGTAVPNLITEAVRRLNGAERASVSGRSAAAVDRFERGRSPTARPCPWLQKAGCAAPGYSRHIEVAGAPSPSEKRLPSGSNR